jgi:prevent-host-death family protein
VRVAEIGVSYARTTWGALLDRVKRGEAFVITRYGKPVARLAPWEPAIDLQSVDAAFDRIRARAKTLPPIPFDWEALKADRDEGRP